MKPVIGITTSYHWKQRTFSLKEAYFTSVKRAGGVPVLLPPLMDPEDAVELVDGLLFSGGGDIHPKYYGEPISPRIRSIEPYRDEFELELFKLAYEREIPVLGICRGAQLINVALGGTLYQDLASEVVNAIKHDWFANGGDMLPRDYPIHPVKIKLDTRLFGILKERLEVESTSDAVLAVNSYHHQAIKRLGEGLKAVAYAPDGIIEAVEGSESFLIGLQWHAEWMENMLPVFRALVEEASRYRGELEGDEVGAVAGGE
ncbi:gamma-glutamyl-gamma-aminobutyrate hydrolase family protein [Palaeococcus ferrophilus]|uniref:gamma-glutamyl-gamma-aminobutyrate hydrolase family protein n=1 Tax=Palaeococcus ferrophilus TaxID=83868 RepID=UPI00064EFA60|nr:gamma-glutamyl-gamma-aminobutyrate hydrolase family protein [Palaeococcus ferrophilus]